MENNFETNETSINKEEAEMQICGIRDQIAVMGVNDSEFSAIEGILKGLDEGEIDPKKAVADVQKIRDSKQDYH